MNTIMKYMIAAFAAACTMATACTKDEQAPDNTERPTFVRIAAADYEPNGGQDDDTDLASAHACLFEDGSMTEIFASPVSDASGYGFRTTKGAGTLYVMTDAIDIDRLHELQMQGITESEWLQLTAGMIDGQPRRFLSGSTSLPTRNGSTVSLIRGTARFDLELRTVGEARIECITINGAAVSSRIFDGGSAADEAREEIVFRPEKPYAESTRGVAHLYGQDGDGLTITVAGTIDGRPMELEAEAPAQILRNRIYVINITREYADNEVSMSVEPWEEGEDVGMVPDLDGTITIDASASSLPGDAVISEDGRTLTLPYTATDIRLALACDDELELQPVTGYPLTVGQAAADGTSIPARNTLLIEKPRYAPGMPADEVTVMFRRKGLGNIYDEDCITLRLEANPTLIEGEMSFEPEHCSYDFGRYVDNELGRLTPPAGKSITVEFAAGEDPWIKLQPADDSERTLRVLGGWKPNDPTADGRVQSATIVICNEADGSEREEYVVSRRNFGLPVTWLHGVWWCKYNARGNSRDFTDQILCPSDPAAAAGKRVIDYLRDCTAEEFYNLWGWAYQGDSGQGMRVIDDNGKLVMEGFSTDVAAHINKLPADALSPDGYELPSMEEFNRMFDATDYVWIMWSGTHTLRTPWEGHSTVKREQRRRNDLTVGTVTATDILYTGMWSPDFPEYEPVTWYGPGAQWNADGIKHSSHYNNILFAVHSPEGSGWYFNGTMAGLYLTKNGAGTKDTRIVRFKKSPVEYIYGVE